MLRRVAEAARKAPPPSGTPRAADLLLAGLAIRFTDGYVAGAPLLKDALRAFLDEDGRVEQDVRWPGFARVCRSTCSTPRAVTRSASRSVQLARERGALGVLPLALDNLASILIFEGDLDAAGTLVEESDVIADATGIGRDGVRPAVAGRPPRRRGRAVESR